MLERGIVGIKIKKWMYIYQGLYRDEVKCLKEVL